MTEKKTTISDNLYRYDVSIMRRNFGVSTSRVAVMNNYADAITALSTDFQHQDPCNIMSMKMTLENVSNIAFWCDKVVYKERALHTGPSRVGNT